MMTDKEHRERNARLEQLAVEDALSKANDPSVRQYAASGVMIGKRSATPTFEEFVNALCSEDRVIGGVLYRHLDPADGVSCGVQDTVDVTPQLKAAYARLYGEQPDVKPKPKIAELMAAFSYHSAKEKAIMNIFGSTTNEARDRCADNDDKLKADLINKGLAHLIDWEDGF